MRNAGSLFLKLMITLFSLLFIFPALVFSILVLCLTDDLKSGTVMLVAALFLLVLIKMYNQNQFIYRSERHYAEGYYQNGKPPPLGDFYFEMDRWKGETDELSRLIREGEPSCMKCECKRHDQDR